MYNVKLYDKRLGESTYEQNKSPYFCPLALPNYWGNCHVMKRSSFWMPFFSISFLAAAVTLLALSIGSLPLCILGLCFTGISYGAYPTITSAFTSSFFGMKYFSTNMALITFTVMGGSLITTVSNKILEVTGGYSTTFLMLLVLTFIALVLNLFIRKP